MTIRNLLFAAILTAIAKPALAGSLWVGPTAGIGLPLGDFKDVASTGFNVGLLTDVEVNRNFAWGGEFGWQTYGGNDDFEKSLSASLGTSVNVTTTAVPVLLHGKLMIPSGERSIPYAKIALGLYRLKSKIEASSGDSDDSSIDFTFGIGGGWNIKAGQRAKYGFEGMFHLVSSDPSATIFLARAQLQFGGGS